MKARLLRLVFLIACAGSLGACSSGFDAKWQAAAHRRAIDPYAGRWAGEWKSSRNRFHGGLECVLTKATSAPSGRSKELRYTADFHAHWHGLSSSYTVVFPTTKSRDGLTVRGQQDLGLLQGGTYKYDGLITPSKFRLDYDSRYDTGVFELKRVPAGREALHGPK